MVFVNDSTRLTLTGGWRVKEEKNFEKELRAALALQKLAAFARSVYRKDGQQRDQ
ncbi:MAG: hypothetical protein HYU84_18585 [Chloroflexi bacterium]|nr:hypothetical protein [Chloroflexota bacterium]MBI3170799.1 hypothetical protein [Chloroflexota bacterium]